MNASSSLSSCVTCTTYWPTVIQPVGSRVFPLLSLPNSALSRWRCIPVVSLGKSLFHSIYKLVFQLRFIICARKKSVKNFFIVTVQPWTYPSVKIMLAWFCERICSWFERRFMSKGSHAVTKSVITRLCEWRGLNVCCKVFVARKRNCGDTILFS